MTVRYWGELPDPAKQDGINGSFALLIGIGQNRRRVHRPSHQSFLRRPLPRIVKSFEKLNITRGQHGRRNAVAVQ